MLAWVKRLADEGHQSERIARRFHIGQAIAYGFLIAGYVCMISYHWAAAARHHQAAQRLNAARRGNSGVADLDDDQGC